MNSLAKSRPWFYNWLKRYQAADGDGNWFEDQSRAPKTTPTKVSKTLKQQVLSIRKELEAKGIAQTGAIAISYELHNRGFYPSELWTINRILARHRVARNKPIRRSNKEYPELCFHTHQMDLVGPRWIKGDGLFYSVNIIDSLSHSCFVSSIRTKASLCIAQALAGFWTTHGMPDALQMDNELAFRGSNRYSRSFGTVVRFALAMGIAPVFIPAAEPWRNGIIERFNYTYDKRCYRSQEIADFDHLKQISGEFSYSHNSHHLSNESFPVNSSLKYSYVVAQISVENHCLHVLKNNNIIQTIEYTMPVDG